MSLQSSLSVLVPSLVTVFLAIVVSAGIGCSRYSYYRAIVDPCQAADPNESFCKIEGEWKKKGCDEMILFQKYKEDYKLSANNVDYPLIRKGPGHYMLREGFHNWKGILVTNVRSDQLTLMTNDGNATSTYVRR